LTSFFLDPGVLVIDISMPVYMTAAQAQRWAAVAYQE
jgi:hypothetical protein